MVQCARIKTNGEQCRRAAMKGKRCCYSHGSGGRKPTHGRYSDVLPKDLVDLYEYFKSDPDLMNLTPEIAQIRAWWGRFTKQFDGLATEPCETCGKAAMIVTAEVLAEMRAFADSVRKLVETKDKIENGERYTLNIGTLGAIIEQMREAIAAEVTDPAVLERIAARFAKLGGRG